MYDIWHLRGAINTGDTCARHHCHVFPYSNCYYYSCCHSHHHPCHHFSDVKVEYVGVLVLLLLVVACKDEEKKAQRIRMSCKAINISSPFLFPILKSTIARIYSDSVNTLNNLCYLYQEPSILHSIWN